VSTHIVIMFPYSGYESGTQREQLFWETLRCCWKTTNNLPVLVVLNRDTEQQGKADAFLADTSTAGTEEATGVLLVRKTWSGGREVASGPLIIHRCWSVDTCQMWLSGWGQVIDRLSADQNDDRLVQLPGDIEAISDHTSFFNSNLKRFIKTGDCDIAVGDFSSGDMFGAKELVDLYGTYALMANWFPEVAKQIRQTALNKPRSEFLNIRVGTLRKLLKHRKFAYEQTLNMLIRSWDFGKNDWEYEILIQPLGVIKDDSTFRQYRDCLDQIERTERMLKLLWRDIYDPEKKSPPALSDQQSFIDQYDTLDRHSTSIRESARITLRNFLGFGPQQE
jgi:hypothetical protein